MNASILFYLRMMNECMVDVIDLRYSGCLCPLHLFLFYKKADTADIGKVTLIDTVYQYVNKCIAYHSVYPSVFCKPNEEKCDHIVFFLIDRVCDYGSAKLSHE